MLKESFPSVYRAGLGENPAYSRKLCLQSPLFGGRTIGKISEKSARSEKLGRQLSEANPPPGGTCYIYIRGCAYEG